MFLRRFLRSSLVNLLLLASLKERSTCRVLGCFLEAKDRDNLEEGFLVDKAAGDRFALLWKAVTEPEVEASRSETRGSLSLSVLHSGVHGLIPSSGD